MAKDNMMKTLCSLSNDYREKTYDMTTDVMKMCDDIKNAKTIECKEFRMIVRLSAVKNDINDDDMKEHTEEMIKMQKYYEVQFTKHNIETQDHRVSFMCDSSFRPTRTSPPLESKSPERVASPGKWWCKACKKELSTKTSRSSHNKSATHIANAKVSFLSCFLCPMCCCSCVFFCGMKRFRSLRRSLPLSPPCLLLPSLLLLLQL